MSGPSGPCSDGEPDSRSHRDGHRQFALAVGAIGVVFGDIGTSPIYALRECFAPERGIAVARENVVGIVSLLLWLLTLVVCLKYLGIVLRADNRGEGGILALVSLVSRTLPRDSARRKAFVVALGILGAALLLSDGMITPAISVLSAVEGLALIGPGFGPYIVPISLVVLVALFSVQSRGTGKIGLVFGPVIALWFLAMGVLGVVAIAGEPSILLALDPRSAAGFVVRNPVLCFGVLGSVILALTGAEVLYADLGHFGSKPIRRSWFTLVYPALAINYLGQGAYLIEHPGEVDNLFFRLVPYSSLYTPLVVLATAATIIASQAVISGAFSLMRQCVQLGYWPRITVRHTSSETIGQVYVPVVNHFLLAGTVALVLAFRSSGSLGNAYGIAVSATMLMTSCLMIVLARKAWNVSPLVIAPFAVVFLAIDGALFAANVTKIVSGGWIVVAFAVFLFTLMKTWIDGRELFGKKVEAFRIDLDTFARSLAIEPPPRVQGTAVFLTASPRGVPKALLHNLKHNKVLHERTIVLSIQTTEESRVCLSERATLQSLGPGLWFLVLRFGFSETPDVPKALASVRLPGLEADWSQVTYFIGRESIIVGKRGGMLPWRKRLFSFLFGNAVSPTDFFRLPPDNIIALGSQTEM